MSTLVDSTETNGRTLGPRSSRRCAPAVRRRDGEQRDRQSGKQVVAGSDLGHADSRARGRRWIRSNSDARRGHYVFAPAAASISVLGACGRRVEEGRLRDAPPDFNDLHPNQSRLLPGSGLRYRSSQSESFARAAQNPWASRVPVHPRYSRARRLTRIRPPESGARMSP